MELTLALYIHKGISHFKHHFFREAPAPTATPRRPSFTSPIRSSSPTWHHPPWGSRTLRDQGTRTWDYCCMIRKQDDPSGGRSSIEIFHYSWGSTPLPDPKPCTQHCFRTMKNFLFVLCNSRGIGQKQWDSIRLSIGERRKRDSLHMMRRRSRTTPCAALLLPKVSWWRPKMAQSSATELRDWNYCGSSSLGAIWRIEKMDLIVQAVGCYVVIKRNCEVACGRSSCRRCSLVCIRIQLLID